MSLIKGTDNEEAQGLKLIVEKYVFVCCYPRAEVSFQRRMYIFSRSYKIRTRGCTACTVEFTGITEMRFYFHGSGLAIVQIRLFNETTLLTDEDTLLAFRCFANSATNWLIRHGQSNFPPRRF